jgi:hypothetical protein
VFCAWSGCLEPHDLARRASSTSLDLPPCHGSVSMQWACRLGPAWCKRARSLGDQSADALRFERKAPKGTPGRDGQRERSVAHGDHACTLLRNSPGQLNGALMRRGPQHEIASRAEGAEIAAAVKQGEREPEHHDWCSCTRTRHERLACAAQRSRRARSSSHPRSDDQGSR